MVPLLLMVVSDLFLGMHNVVFFTWGSFMLVTFLWIFFRAENIAAAFAYIKGICSFTGGSDYLGLSRGELIFSMLVAGIMLLREKFLPGHIINSDRHFYLYIVAMICICYFFGVFAENQFIYFQF